MSLEKDHDEIVPEEDKGQWGYRLEDLDDSDIDDDDGDLITEQHITVYNKDALLRIRQDFELDQEDLAPFESLSVTSAEPIKIVDVFDDLSREQAFYDQALEAARIVLQQTKEHDAPFLPPLSGDYMTLRDARQSRNTAAAKRSIKKIKADKEMEETEQMIDRAKLLSRKRKDRGNEMEGFMLGEDYMDDDDDEEEKAIKKWKANSPNMKLKRKPSQYGKKQPFSAMKNKKKSTNRPGKSRRNAQRNRR
ncbi:hypothetical protein BJV82DRAFT_653895 [Fennellomyces sp. T-0311]|nr:hypothetical protein BJV82DRAFT_653895 [Fennellomyces sp. T-0311]